MYDLVHIFLLSPLLLLQYDVGWVPYCRDLAACNCQNFCRIITEMLQCWLSGRIQTHCYHHNKTEIADMKIRFPSLQYVIVSRKTSNGSFCPWQLLIIMGGVWVMRMEGNCIASSSSLQWRNVSSLHHNFLFRQFMVAPFMHLTRQLAPANPASQVQKDATSRNWFSRRARYG